MGAVICEYTGGKIVRSYEETDWFSKFYLTEDNIAVTKTREGIVLNLNMAKEQTRLRKEFGTNYLPSLFIDNRGLIGIENEVYNYYWSPEYNIHYAYAAILTDQSVGNTIMQNFVTLLEAARFPVKFRVFTDTPNAIDEGKQWLLNKVDKVLLERCMSFNEYTKNNERDLKYLAGFMQNRTQKEISETSGLSISTIKSISKDEFLLKTFGTTYSHKISKHIAIIPELDARLDQEAQKYPEKKLFGLL